MTPPDLGFSGPFLAKQLSVQRGINVLLFAYCLLVLTFQDHDTRHAVLNWI